MAIVAATPSVQAETLPKRPNAFVQFVKVQPLGVMAFWPLSREFYFADAFIFEAISRRYWLPNFITHNLLAVAPSGAMAFWCGSGWFSSSGQMLYVGSRDVLAFDGVRLLSRESLVDTAAHTEQRLVLPDAPVLTARVTSDGFWLVLQNGDPGAAELWHVARAGAAQLLGSYPAPPADATIQYSSRLAGDGALFQLATDAGSGHVRDLIVRRTLAGAAEVVYDEADEPLVRIHGSGLVTGP